MSKIKIAIVDDHQLFRNGIASLLESNGDFEVILSEGSGASFLSQLENDLIPEVVLLDLTMPEMSGFDVLKILSSKYPEIKPIALSMHDDGNYIVKCVREGAKGYLLKNTDEEELIEAIKRVNKGEKYFNKTVSEQMIGIMALEGSDPKRLSPKEQEVIKLISDGLTTKEIAAKLFVSTRTIETHRVNMMKKLGVKNSAELIKKATKLKII
ncbi:MAG: response regulator transcription factor [Cyclobacteriaceae bacterium]